MLAYLDEVGDHSLSKVDPGFPVFALLAVVFREDHYTKRVTPGLCELKLKHFGTDAVILHSHDIRRHNKPFDRFKNPEIRAAFFEDTNRLLTELEYTLFCSVIQKQRLKERYAFPDNPYELSLMFLLERFVYFLNILGGHDKQMKLVAEGRGKKEDKDLELAFFRFTSGGTQFVKSDEFSKYKFSLTFCKKEHNLAGNEMADLLSYPFARSVLSPGKALDLYEIAKSKLYSPHGRPQAGLKIFP